MDINWNHELADQLVFPRQHQPRPRLDGLTDAEYFWEPVPGCWSIRRRGDASTPLATGPGEFVIDYAMPPHDPEPVTTIAWRLAHIIIGVFGSRNASHFGRPPADWPTWDYATTADAALRQLGEGPDSLIKGVRGLRPASLAAPRGPP